MFIFLFALYGIVNAIIDANQRAFVSDLSDEKIRATALGAFHTTIGIISIPSSLIAGFTWKINPSLPFLLSFFISFISFIFIILFKKSLILSK
jgi:hypothetical protein